MRDPVDNDPQAADQPLSAEAQAVLRKARRSFGVSIGILLLGFMAIGLALVYRVLRDAPPPATAEAVTLPAGAEIVSAMTNGNEVQVTYRLNGATVLALFDQATGEVTRSLQINVPAGNQ